MPEVNKHEVGQLARAVMEYADKKCYGLGECGYYFKEWASSYTTPEHAEDERYLKDLAMEAEDLAFRLQDQKEEYGV
jgi:hypothetical protein